MAKSTHFMKIKVISKHCCIPKMQEFSLKGVCFTKRSQYLHDNIILCIKKFIIQELYELVKYLERESLGIQFFNHLFA